MTQPPDRHECRCGRPILDGAHLCPLCVATLRSNLLLLAERWGELEAALSDPEPSPLHLVPAPRSRDNTGNPTGIALNEPVSNARRVVANLAWFAVQVIRDDFDELGRTFRAPADQSVPGLLRWVERWHVRHLVTDGAEETAHELARDAERAEAVTNRVLKAVRTIYVGLPCVEHETSADGERVPCDGQMTARVVSAVLPDLVCTRNRDHRADPLSWQRAGWRERLAGPLDRDGMRGLVERLATRGGGAS